MIISFKSFNIIMLFSIALYIVSCTPDKEDEPVPTTNPKLRFVADWTCSEVSRRDQPAQPFQIHLLNGNGDTLIMENCYAVGFNKKSTLVVSGDNIRFAPNNQQISTGIFMKSGQGNLINSNTIKMTYIIDDGNPVLDTVDATFSK
jgi:hypothetical protein